MAWQHFGMGPTGPGDLYELLPNRRVGAPGPPETRATSKASVRLPASLHQRARIAAATHATTLTALVERALSAELAMMEDPAARFSALVAASARRRLAGALADGSWDEAVAAYTATDPDLAT